MAIVAATITLDMRAKETGTNDLGSPSLPITIHEALEINPSGATGLDHADTLFADTRTLASAASENLDMNGVLIDAFGTIVSNAEVVGIYLKAAPANTTTLAFFGATTNAFNGPLSGTAPKLSLAPGEWVFLGSRNGWGVTAATGDILAVANGTGAAASYSIAVIGRTVVA